MTKENPVVLQILPRLETGGVERGTVEIASALKQVGWKSIVVSGGGGLVRELERLGTTHIALDVYSKNPFVMKKNAKKLAEIIREYGVDIVHARSRAPAWSAKWAAEMTEVPFLTTFHGRYNLGPFDIKKSYNRVMTEGRLVIAVSNFIKDHILETYKIDPEKIRVIHRGADVEKFDTKKVHQNRLIALVEKWRVPEDKPIIMLPGRLTRWKGQSVMIEALSLMKHKDVCCLLVGSDQGRVKYRKELEEKVKTLGLGAAVHIVDHCSEMDVAYTLSQIVVSTSVEPEAFGRVLPEAQSMERIVVGTSHGGAMETVFDGKTGFLVPPNDPQALADVLDKILALPAGEKLKIQQAARKSVSESFSKDLMCEKTLSVYKEILGIS